MQACGQCLQPEEVPSSEREERKQSRKCLHFVIISLFVSSDQKQQQQQQQQQRAAFIYTHSLEELKRGKQAIFLSKWALKSPVIMSSAINQSINQPIPQ